MKTSFAILSSLSLVWNASAGESALIPTFQPLHALGAGGIRIVEVWCHDWYGHSSQPTAIGLISARNVPPTNSDQAKNDLNLASACHLKFSCPDIGAEEPELRLAADRFEAKGGHEKEEILRASLECLRRVLPQQLLKTELKFTASAEDRKWMDDIISKFNTCDRTKSFYEPGQ